MKKMSGKPKNLVVGIGSCHGDDQWGWLVVDALASRHRLNTWSFRKAKSPSDLLNWVAELSVLVICDACCFTGSAGVLRTWNWPDDRLAQVRRLGSHDFDLATVLKLAERLEQLPAVVKIWSVDAVQAEPNAALSAQVAARFDDAVATIDQSLRESVGRKSHA